MVSRTSSGSHNRTPGQHLAAACSCLPQLQSQPATRRCSSHGSLNGNSNRRSNGSWPSAGSFSAGSSSRTKTASQGLLALLLLVVMCCFFFSSILLSRFGNTHSKSMLEQQQQLRLARGDTQEQQQHQQQHPGVAQTSGIMAPLAVKAAAVAAMQLPVSRQQPRSFRLQHHGGQHKVGRPQQLQQGWQQQREWQQQHGHVQKQQHGQQHVPVTHQGLQPVSAPAMALLVPDEPAPAHTEPQQPPWTTDPPPEPVITAPAALQQQTSGPTSLQDDVPAELRSQEWTSRYARSRGAEPQRLRYPLWWHGPIWSGSGYGSEAINFVLSLLRTGRLAPDDLWVQHHGDDFRKLVVESLSEPDRQELMLLQSLPAKYQQGKRAAVVVCHSVPTNWVYPEPMWAAGAPCPPDPAEHAWVYQIGRTMFETDKLPAIFVPRLNAMNEIWVPSRWQLETFAASGVDPDKLVIVPEGVNTTLFDPAKHTALDLTSKAQLVFGRLWRDKQLAAASPAAAAAAAVEASHATSNATSQGNSSSTASSTDHHPGSSKAVLGAPGSSNNNNTNTSHRPFRFISTFKWEQRKGWPILLEAYLSEFTAEDDVELFILTQPFEKSGAGFQEKMRSWADQLYHSASAISTQRNRKQQQEASAKQADNDAILSATLQAAAEAQAAAVEERLTAQQRLLLAAPLTSLPTRTTMAALPAVKMAGHAAGAGGGDGDAGGHGHLQQQEWLGGDAGAATSGGAISGAVTGGLPEDAAVQPAAGGDLGRSWMITDDQRQQVHAASIIKQIQSFARSLPSMPLQQPEPAAAAAVAASNGQPASPAQPQQLLLHHYQRSLLVKPPASHQPPTDDAATTTAGGEPNLPEAPPDDAPSLAAGAALEAAKYPTLYVVDSHISDEEFPAFYKAGDAFVLPTRGEGWGRPHVEAMSMGLPVISTNWSGITAYLDESVGYPIAVEKLVPVPSETTGVTWWFKGLKWAQPSVGHLRQLMRRVYTNKAEAAARGAAARARMVNSYSPDSIAEAVLKELTRIENLIP